MQAKRIIHTDDGSNTLYAEDIDETYHSTFGAIQESQLIFVDYGLKYINKKTIDLLEIGFGTGLNAMLTIEEGKKSNSVINYQTIELYPVETKVIEELKFPFNQDILRKIHHCDWNSRVEITNNFFLTKRKEDFSTVLSLPNFDLCFFDAFSPDKQPKLWSLDRLELLYRHANSGAIVTTYCCKGDVKRGFRQAGFEIEKLPGPIGKREVLRARKM